MCVLLILETNRVNIITLIDEIHIIWRLPSFFRMLISIKASFESLVI